MIPEGDNLKLRELCHLEDHEDKMRTKIISDNRQYLHQLVVLVGGQISAGLLLLAGDDDGDSGDFLAAHLDYDNPGARQGTMDWRGHSTRRYWKYTEFDSMSVKV